MSNFTPLVKKQYDFEGDTVTVRFARMRRKHMLKMIPKIQSAQDDQDKVVDVLNDLLEMLPEYVKEFDGLTNAAGEPVTIDVVADDMYFSGLASDIAMDVLNESSAFEGASAKND
jgi:hypothetical protein